MAITKGSINNFVNSLASKIKTNRKEIIKPVRKSWDPETRPRFYDFLQGCFCQEFKISLKNAEKYVYVEGQKSIPEKHRTHKFFNSRMCPDAAIIDDNSNFKIAIELDHGKYGCQIRYALAKASFSVRLAKYDRAVVFFFVDSPKSEADFQRGKTENEIIKLYQEDPFNTTLHIL